MLYFWVLHACKGRRQLAFLLFAVCCCFKSCKENYKMALELSSYKAKLRAKGTEIIFCSKAAFSLCTDEIKRCLKILGGGQLWEVGHLAGVLGWGFFPLFKKSSLKFTLRMKIWAVSSSYRKQNQALIWHGRHQLDKDTKCISYFIQSFSLVLWSNLSRHTHTALWHLTRKVEIPMWEFTEAH